ncbi:MULTISPECIES: dethiobiotin synthase [Candidatus Nitrosocaldus]|jgi:dethiobiotin synthetase|uniref:ATP-dependent dethiobiotin synthetase BioD n=1 Tax=Candidatus Nitrosocaldus cavascurensis TaxID=2058097 RepID=A0A2K5ASF7_9ARCH|nr:MULTISPECIES: dethiobiotin synthase [Candidatus Nitrosocaldus]SPC34586.1 ATP-dependent dethiobiotin synthetase BioD [Candidatus Nitrosocaldus cavascurensis]
MDIGTSISIDDDDGWSNGSGGGVFVTGTDTGVGKTLVTAAIVHALRSDGIDAVGMKPIATGIDRDVVFKSTDAEIIAKYSCLSSEEHELVNPVFLALEAAPYMASIVLKQDVDIERVFKAYKRLKERHEFIVVEGIGGVMVPIKKDYYVLDLIRDLELPALIVARARLGTINHTLLTVEACKRRGVEVIGIIMNMIDHSSIVEVNAGSIIQELSRVPVIGSIPYIKEMGVDDIPYIAKYIRYDLLLT